MSFTIEPKTAKDEIIPIGASVATTLDAAFFSFARCNMLKIENGDSLIASSKSTNGIAVPARNIIGSITIFAHRRAVEPTGLVAI